MAEAGKLVIEDARVVFRNFAGKEGQYNREGDRNFCVLLDEELAETMSADGWNVKSLKSREEGEPGQKYIQVSVAFKGKPPKIAMISSKGRTNLGEDEIELLDIVDYKMVDLIINPYPWNINGKSGVSAYLGSLFVTIEESVLDLKYGEIDEVQTRNGRVEE